jgi:SAM-dependent methyltransferase
VTRRMSPSLKGLRAALTGNPDAAAAPAAAPTTGWLKLPEREYDAVVKPAVYLPIYESLLAPLRDQPLKLLELGIWNGDSLEMWRDSLPNATIVGVDIGPPELELGPRVHVLRGDQTDGPFLAGMATEHAPEGFDVIIDDASHYGAFTARSLQTLYMDHLKPGGIYIIEDWGTGYLANWHDGATPSDEISIDRLDASPAAFSAEPGPVPMPSHDVGMVGLVKRLVDHTASTTLTHLVPERTRNLLAIESLQIHDGVVVLRKPAG